MVLFLHLQIGLVRLVDLVVRVLELAGLSVQVLDGSFRLVQLVVVLAEELPLPAQKVVQVLQAVGEAHELPLLGGLFELILLDVILNGTELALQLLKQVLHANGISHGGSC